MRINRDAIILAIVAGVALALTAFAAPRLFAAATFLLGYGPLRDLFADRFGMGEAASSLLAYALTFFMPIATYVLFANMFAVWSGRPNPTRVATAFVAYSLVYLLPAGTAVIRDSFGAPQCFLPNGTPRLYYSIEPNGAIELKDAPGFNSFGSERKPITSEICRIADRQRKGVRPTLITSDPRDIEFFDAAGGGVRVFFSRSVNGSLMLFDGPGVDPSTNEILQPVTPVIIEEAKRARADAEQREKELAKRRAEAVEAARKNRNEIAAAERIQKEIEAAQRNARAEALDLLSRQAASSRTGYECAFGASGPATRQGTNSSQYASWSQVQARASYASFDRQFDGLPRGTGLVAELRLGISADGRDIRCVVVIAAPAPVQPSQAQLLRVKLVLESLQQLGVRIVAWEPSAASRRNALLPRGVPPDPQVYGCLRNGMPAWCRGENRCAKDRIPVVAQACTFFAGAARCPLQCAL